MAHALDPSSFPHRVYLYLWSPYYSNNKHIISINCINQLSSVMGDALFFEVRTELLNII
jgi:hypothetical protein